MNACNKLFARLFGAQANHKTKKRPRNKVRLAVDALEPRLTPTIHIEFNYDCDASSFFADQSRRDLLQAAAAEITARLYDTLAELPEKVGGDSWVAVFENPGTGTGLFPAKIGKTRMTVKANTLVIFVAGRDFDDQYPQIARAVPGTVEVTGLQAWQELVKSRGESGALASPATDYGPWGGSISFNSAPNNWYFGPKDNDPADMLRPDQFDFFSVAQRALGQILGFGSTPAWNRFLVDGSFRGPSAAAHYGAPVPVATLPDIGSFWQQDTPYNGKPTAMDADYDAGERVHFTELDIAALGDMGWELTPPPGVPGSPPLPAPPPLPGPPRFVITGIAGLTNKERVFNPFPTLNETAAFNGMTYNVGRDDDDALWVEVSRDGGKTFSDRTEFQGAEGPEEAASSPSLTRHGDKLFMAWHGTDSDGYVNVAVIRTAADGRPVALEEKIVLGYTAYETFTGLASRVIIKSHNDALFLLWVGEDEQLYLDFLSEAKPHWGPNAFATGEYSNSFPALWDRDGRLLMFWDGLDGLKNVARVELLSEARQPLEAYPLVNGTLTIYGDRTAVNQNDTLAIASWVESGNAGGVEITLNGARTRFGYQKVSRIIVHTGGGNDTIMARPDITNLTLDIWSGDGNDTITVQGTFGSAYVNGGDGDDAINLERLGRGHTARLHGGPGENRFSLGAGPQSLSNIEGSVVIDGTWVGHNSLTLNDRRNGGLSANYTLTPGGVRLPNAVGSVAYERIAEVTLLAPTRGNSTVKVEGNAFGVSTFIDNAETVLLGGPGRFANVGGSRANRTDPIRGSIHISTFTLPTALTIDDSGTSATPRTVSLGSNFVEGLTENPIDFTFADLSSLTVTLGSAGNTVTVRGTRTSNRTAALVLNTGLGADTVTVLSMKTSVTVNGQRGLDTVHLGWDGSLQSIRGALTVTNLGRYSAVTLDNSADTIGRNVELTSAGSYSEIRGLAPATIRVRQRDLSAFSMIGGPGNNTFTIRDTPQSTFPGGMTTRIEARDGNDHFNVYRTSGPLALEARGGQNLITVGSSANGLGLINGAVFANGGGNSSFLVNDAVTKATPSMPKYEYIVDVNVVQRTDKAAIFYQSTANLTLYTSQATDYVTIRGTAPFAEGSAGTVIGTARGDDYVTIRGTNGYLRVDLGADVGRVSVGDATNSLDAIRGQVDLAGAGFDVVISNEASTTAQSATFSRSELFGLPAETLVRQEYRNGAYVTLNTFHVLFSMSGHVAYRAGQAGDTMFVNGTQSNVVADLYGNPAAQEVSAVGFGADTNAILGSVFVLGQAANGDSAYYYDYLNPNPQTYTVQSFLPSLLTVSRSGIAPVSYYGLAGVSLYAPAVGGNSLNVRSTPAGTQLGVAAGNGDRITVGSNAPNLGGTVDGIQGHLFVGPGVVNGGATMIVDDSGNAAASRDVSINRFEFLGTVYGRIDGLTPGGITFQDHDNWIVDLRGGALDDRFRMAGNPLGARVSIDGGGGVNTLDYSAYNPAIPGLVSWWKGENNALDAASNLHGTAVNVTYTAGKVGQAFAFTGALNQYVEVNDAPILRPETVTVEAWVNSQSAPAGRTIVAKGAMHGVEASYALVTGLDLNKPGGLVFYLSSSPSPIVSPDAGPGIWDGNWHHVAGVYDGTAVRLYVDGVEVGKGTPYSGSIRYGSEINPKLYVGAFDAASSYPSFVGKIDEVGIYDHALSQEGIQRVFAAGAAGKSALAQGVAVNLPNQTASGLAGGIAKIQNVIGSAGNDILVGTGGTALTGGAGRDLLIAGAVASYLYGGDDEDILIGGTINDSSQENLAAITAEWARIGDGNDYSSRVARLRAGLLADNKITGNGGNNTMTGGAGLDLFFGSLVTDWQVDDGEQAFPLWP